MHITFCLYAKICCAQARGSNDAVGAKAKSPSRNSRYDELAGKRTVLLSGEFAPILASSADTVHPRGRWQPQLEKGGDISHGLAHHWSKALMM
ncbi:hypothetical protein M514_07732 [Trichuris suis]|uniref:Uncharacterized protein n=1 Tax=Trichuris suis TaxID=68888 RepID=A0A085MT48_9BILA|nr:hypothetical protein M513_07732 [Trichuris suis]KFD60394.1 hypothetical protein M514_07732 [Trichuris suis]